MDTTTIILVAVIVVGLALIVVVRMLRSRPISSSQTLDNDPTYPPFSATSTDSNPDVDIQQIALRFLSKGQKIEAVKRVREATGWGLKEAKDYVDAIENGSVLSVAAQPVRKNSLPGDLRDTVLALIGNGRKIEAIKVVRECTYMELREAKDYVDALETGSSPPAPFRIEPAESVPDAVRDTALTLIRDGRKIEAIKVVREHTNWGLKEAKEWVDAVESDPSYRTDW